MPNKCVQSYENLQVQQWASAGAPAIFQWEQEIDKRAVFALSNTRSTPHRDKLLSSRTFCELLVLSKIILPLRRDLWSCTLLTDMLIFIILLPRVRPPWLGIQRARQQFCTSLDMRKALCIACLPLFIHSTYSLSPPWKWKSVHSTLEASLAVLALKEMFALLLRKANSRSRARIVSGLIEILQARDTLIPWRNSQMNKYTYIYQVKLQGFKFSTKGILLSWVILNETKRHLI